MAKYLFVYHGGSAPTSPADKARIMDAWGRWFGSLGPAVIDGGNPVGPAVTVRSDRTVVTAPSANPPSGYSLIEAADRDDAVAKARGCPLLAAGGSVEVAEAFDM